MITGLPCTYKAGQVAEISNETMRSYPEIVEKHKEQMKETLLKQFQNEINPKYTYCYDISYVVEEKPSNMKGYKTIIVRLLAEIKGGLNDL